MRKIKHIFFNMFCVCLLIVFAAELVPAANAASSMTTSTSCIEFIKSVEGFSSQPYYDYNQYTVGYGTKCPSEKFFDYKSNGIPKNEAEELLRKELAEIEDTLSKKLIDKYNLTFTQHQFDALVSFSFNIGTGWITYDSTLRNAILRNAGENDLVYAFGLYCTAGGKYLPGLVTRRLCEADMYLNGSYSKKLSDDFGYVYFDANGGSITYRVQGFVCANQSAPAANATRSGDVFLGWYTDLTGGSQVTVLDGTLTGKTLFARWQSSESTGDQNTNGTTVKVTGDVVNIRSGPGTNYGILKRAYRNENVTVSHVTHLTNMKWGKLQDGWICLDYTNYDNVIGGTDSGDEEINEEFSDESIVPDEDADEEYEDTVIDNPSVSQEVITGIVHVNDFLKIRSGPGTTYATAGYLFNGNKVQITEQKTAGSMVWGRMEKGWVCMDYIVTGEDSADITSKPGTEGKQEEAPRQEIENTTPEVETTSVKGKITADALRIRSGAGTENPIVGFYYQNDRVVVTQKAQVGSVSWGKTSRGWISMDYVLPDSSDTESSQPIEQGMRTIIADCLRVRKEAGTEYKIVGFLYDGDTVEILETKDVDGTAWGRVKNGWICMQYTK